MTQAVGTGYARSIRLDDATYSHTLNPGTSTAARTHTFPDVSGVARTTGGQAYMAMPADPTATTSTAGVMMGLAGTFTPKLSSRVLFLVTGQMKNSTSGNGVAVTLRTGTGSAPANGDASTGTTRGNTQQMTSAVANNQQSGFLVMGIATGLTPGTAYWIDVRLAAVTGGTASISNVTIVAVEV